jgi:arylsulfate sulfotransferase
MALVSRCQGGQGAVINAVGVCATNIESGYLEGLFIQLRIPGTFSRSGRNESAWRRYGVRLIACCFIPAWGGRIVSNVTWECGSKRWKARTLLSGGLFAIIGLISGCAGNSTSLPVPTITPGIAVLMAGQTAQFTATENGAPVANPVWKVNNVAGGESATGTISSSGVYTAPSALPSSPILVTVIDSAHSTQSGPIQVFFFNPNQPQAGTVLSTNNVLVANYVLLMPEGASVQVQFGTTTNYGLTTWVQPAPGTGGNVSVLVAGMRQSSVYHMQAIITLPDGTTLYDSDHTFTTGALPADLLPPLTVQQTAGLTPAPGVEMLDLINETANAMTTVVTDLEGNVIWYYPIQPLYGFPIKPLPNGHMLIVTTGSTELAALTAPVNINELQEIDLAGNVLYQLTEYQIDQGLEAAGLPVLGYLNLNHDVLKLPNGHYMLLVSGVQTVNGQSITGNQFIDWDPQLGPVWTWSTFDYISLSHAPYGVSDLTHANALLYSPDDGNLIVSLRNQNWILKLNYKNGTGDGSILWTLGLDGDFTLPAGQAPIEWNYGQHYLSLVSPNSSGIFSLMFFNNGNGRVLDANGDVCDAPGQIQCYSSVPVYQLDESTLTAQVLQETDVPAPFSVCCGNADMLSNGDLEYDVADAIPDVSYIQEVTQGAGSQLVWQMNTAGQLAYRGFRIPSMYPGVVWTQAAIAAANVNATPQPAAKIPPKQPGPWPIVP